VALLRPALLLSSFLSTLALAEPQPDGAEAWVTRARAEGLGQSQAWLRLGHYRPSPLGGFKSEADGPPFFFAPNGRRDPVAELDATLRAFFSPVLPEHSHPDKEHPLCRFPARREYLVRTLGMDPSALPQPPCPKLDAYVERVSARSVTFSFSSYYLGNPSSVFGHTFLRLNRDEQTPDGREKELLDWGINYGGAVDTRNPVLYMLKGLFGGYRGEFLLLPYFYKVREYNDYESRDLWEYRLALEPDEVARLVLHLWELGGTWFDYYYIDENCSWHLLGALEAASPRLALLEPLKAAVLPTDAVHAVLAVPGLVTSIRYRPSLRSQFEQRAAVLDPDGLRAVRALKEDHRAPIRGDAQVQAQVLDAAMDFLDLSYAKEIVFQSSPAVEERRHQLMTRRSKLGLPSPEVSTRPPEQSAPHLAHPSGRMGLGGGFSPTGGGYARFTWRLLLHDLLDPVVGYPAYLRLEVLPLDLRFESARGHVVLEQLDLVRLEYFPAISRFARDISHGTRLGLTTVRDGGCDGCLVGRLEGAAGVSAEPISKGPLLFALGTAALAGGPSLDGAFGGPVRPSVGGRVGMRWHLAPWLSTMISADGWLHAERSIRPSWSGTLGARWHLSRTFSLDVEARRLQGGPELGATALVYY
jgi:hypothetical protein